MLEWSTANLDWREKIVAGESLSPLPEPLFPEEAAKAMDIFNSLKIVDVGGEPTFGESTRPWLQDFVSNVFGSYDAESGKRLMREFFLLISKKNSKSTLAAGIMLTALLRNWRKSGEFIILAPTIEIAQNSFQPALDMIRADPDLSVLLHPNANTRTITHRNTNATLKVLAADDEVVAGKKAIGVLIDELWLFGKRNGASNMLREATGGLASRPEGFVIYLTTQSKEPPAGVFKTKLREFRDIRDGKIKDPKSFGMLYEFPEEMIERKEHLNPKYFFVTNPNMGLSVSEEFLMDEYEKALRQGKTSHEMADFAAKHLNVEIGIGLRTDGWAGADFWLSSIDDKITSLEELVRRSEVVVVGLDGGGLDDLMGFTALGREIGTRRWLSWSYAWAHNIVLKRRKEIAPKLIDLATANELTLTDDSEQIAREVVDKIQYIEDCGKLAETKAIGVDAVGITFIIDELEKREFDLDPITGRVTAIRQGYTLTNAIKTSEQRLSKNDLVHANQELMNFCVGNARVETRGNAIIITKAISGSAKIDPLMALFNAVELMSLNPEAMSSSVFDVITDEENEDPIDIIKRDKDIEWDILANPRDPRFQEMREKFEARLAENDRDWDD